MIPILAERILSLLNKSVEYNLEVKPLNIYDAYGHLTPEKHILNPLRLLNRVQQGIFSVKVYRKPYLGVISKDTEFSHIITLTLNDIGVPAINMGDLHLKKVINILKIPDDLLLIGREDIIKKLQFRDGSNIELEGLRNISIYHYKGKVIIACGLNYIDGIIAALYLIRPLYYLKYRLLVKSYPIQYLNLNEKMELKDGVYPIKIDHQKIVITSSIKEINAFLVVINGSSIIEFIDVFDNQLTPIPEEIKLSH